MDDRHGVVFTGEGKLARKATGYEREKAGAAPSQIGVRGLRKPSFRPLERIGDPQISPTRLFFTFAGIAALMVLPVRAQVFDVASVKPNLSASASSNMHSSHGRFTAANVTVNMLIMFAFRVKDFQIRETAVWLD